MRFCVLIVDDQIESIELVKAMLERRDFQVVVAKNGKEATEKLHEFLPHLLIVDVTLGPDENGLDWLKQVRKGPFKDLPAIMLTGAADQETVKFSMQIGIDDYIVKPGEATTLTKKIVAVQKKLSEQAAYFFSAMDGTLKARMSVDARISAISETGLCISSHIGNKQPYILENFISDLFAEMGVPDPQKITLLNYERESNYSTGFPFRNYCQIAGWTEADFKKVRLWIRRSKLGRSF